MFAGANYRTRLNLHDSVARHKHTHTHVNVDLGLYNFKFMSVYCNYNTLHLQGNLSDIVCTKLHVSCRPTLK